MRADDGVHLAPPPATEGWARRFTAMGARLDEAIALYRALGYDVWLAPADASEEEIRNADTCAQCFVMTFAQTIYTRQPHSARPVGSPADVANSAAIERR